MTDYNEDSPRVIPAPKETPRMSKASASYVENINGTRCGNCTMYVDIGEEKGLCTKVKGEIDPQTGICYFQSERVTSATRDMIDPQMQVSKELAGYEEVPPRGTRCGTCSHYLDPRGCEMVGYEGEGDIDPDIGCCNGWIPDEETATEAKYSPLFKFYGRVEL